MMMYSLENSDSKARKATKYHLRTTLNSEQVWEVDVIRPDGIAVFPIAYGRDESIALSASLSTLANGKTAVKLADVVTLGADLLVFGAILDFINDSILSITDARVMCEIAEGFDLKALPEKLRSEFPALATTKRGRRRDTRTHLKVRNMIQAWEFATGRKVATGENSRFINVAAALGCDRPTVTNYLKTWHRTMPPCPIILQLGEVMTRSPRG